MPNLKIHVEEALWHERGSALRAALPEIRALLCDRLSVPPGACQLALIPVWGLDGQPQINAELHILPRPERTPDLLRALAADLRAEVARAAPAEVAVRIGQLDPTTYIALK